MHEHVKDAHATAIVKLGDTELSVGDLISLQAGDVLPLSQEVSGELSIEVEGVKKLQCLAGEYKGSRAVQITKRVNE
jgi:flagellar motor switch protein FliM